MKPSNTIRIAVIVVLATLLPGPPVAFAEPFAEPGSAGTKELKARRLTSNTPELAIQAAAVSPDGTFIAYSDPLGIHVRATAGGETRLLAGTQGGLLVRWTPDSANLQARVQDAAGVVKTVTVALKGNTPSSALAADPSVASPDGMHRASVKDNPLRLNIQDVRGENARDVWKAATGGTVDQFEWSPNSEQIAVLSSNNGDTVLELVNVAGGQKQVLSTGDKKLSVGSVVWPRRNRLILSIDEDLGINQYDSNLWEAALDDKGTVIPGGLRQLTSWTDFPIRTGSLTSDGKKLVFIRSFRQRGVYVAPLEAGCTRMGTPRRLTLDLSDAYPSAWTRDSKTVILTSSRNVTQGIFRQDLDRQVAEQLVVMPGDQLLARATPEAGTLLFLNYDPAKDKHSQLMRVPVTGGKAELVPNAERVGYDYWCSLAGPCIMAQKQDNGSSVVSELDPAKGKGREIYRDSKFDHLLISPDGRWIASAVGEGPETKIVLRSFATGEVARKIPVRGVTKLVSLDYAPDSKSFFLGDALLTEARELYLDDSGKSSILWRQPGGDSIIWGQPSLDGKKLALVLTMDDANVYVVDSF